LQQVTHLIESLAGKTVSTLPWSKIDHDIGITEALKPLQRDPKRLRLTPVVLAALLEELTIPTYLAGWGLVNEPLKLHLQIGLAALDFLTSD